MQTREPIVSAHLVLRHKSNNEQAASTALHINEEIHPELSERGPNTERKKLNACDLNIDLNKSLKIPYSDRSKVPVIVKRR